MKPFRGHLACEIFGSNVTRGETQVFKSWGRGMCDSCCVRLDGKSLDCFVVLRDEYLHRCVERACTTHTMKRCQRFHLSCSQHLGRKPGS